VRYMVIEHFKEGKAADVYRRLADKGRMAPEGMNYIDSWVSADLRVCYQLMETDDYSLFAKWTQHWEDLVVFEIVPIIPSGEARARALASI
jgi:Protein of unknown function (DUF3303)